MTHTKLYHNSQLERRLYFQSMQSQIEKPRAKSVRALIVGNSTIDDLVPLMHVGVVAEPWHTKDRKRLGSNHPLIVWGIPSCIRDELRTGDVVQVGVCKSVFVGESQIYHNCIYQRTIRNY